MRIFIIALVLLVSHAAYPQYSKGIGIQVKASVVPKANIKTTEGNYHLQSRTQSSFAIGINHHTNPGADWNISTGLHVELTNWNFYIHIPDNDLDEFYSTGGAPQIENKSADFLVSLPVMVIRNFNFNKKGFFNAQAGLKLSYNGFSPGEGIVSIMIDTSNKPVQIFEGEFKTQKNPWVSFLAGFGKSLYLKNRNMLSVDLLFEYSTASLARGDYVISVPNRPVTRGSYSTNRSRIGFSLQYIFTHKRK